MMWTFEPIYKPTVWGGNRLRTYKVRDRQDSCDTIPLGESWELSALPGDESIVAAGPERGMTLSALVNRHGEALLGKHVKAACGNRFPLLIKFIHATADLSVQVHPSDEVARAMGLPNGKNEMWVIVEAEPGACICNGLRTPIRPDDLASLAATGEIIKRLRRIEIKPGDAFYIPAGRVHTIGAGTLLAEIQQPSTDTFRIYDYGRPGLDGKPRELHLDKARLALDCNDVYGDRLPQPADGNALLESPHFTVHRLSITSPVERHPASRDSFVIYMVLHGEATLSTPDDAIRLPQGSTILVSADTDTVTVTPHGSPASLLEIYC